MHMYLEGECTCGAQGCLEVSAQERGMSVQEGVVYSGGGVCLGVSAWECVSQHALWKTPPNYEQND